MSKHTNSADEKKLSEIACVVLSRDGVRCLRPARVGRVCRQHAIKTGLAAKIARAR